MARRVLGAYDWVTSKGGGDSDNSLSRYRPNPLQQKIIAAVEGALARLPSVEKEIVERYFYQGQTIREISESLQCAVGSVERRRQNAIRKLRNYLSSFVEEYFGIKARDFARCLICDSPFRFEIENLILHKPAKENWKRVLRCLREEYHLEVKAPQTIVSHIRFHLEEDNHG